MKIIRVLFIVLVLALLIVPSVAVRAQGGETASAPDTLRPTEIVFGLLAFVAIVGALVTAYLRSKDDKKTADRLIEAIKEARADPDLLNQLEPLATKVVPVELVYKGLDAVANVLAVLGNPNAKNVIGELKGLINQVTDGKPNEAPALQPDPVFNP